MATSRSASPAPFTPRKDNDPDTLQHLLSLPPLLQPISPQLAALHLARVRLLLDVPASPGVGVMTEWWCHSCGGLREGLGGAQPAKRRAAAKKGGRSRTPTKVVGIKRKDAICANCGERFEKAKPDRKTLITYPSARIAARRKKEEAASSQAADPFAMPTTSTDTPLPVLVVESDSGDGMDIDPPARPAQPAQTSAPARPSFSRVKDTEPNLPTYPLPAPAASPEKPKKRKKKSGLAKLLAENKEREAAQNLTSSWGLG